MARPRKTPSTPAEAKPYQHTDADAAARPEIGAQAHFKPNKAPGQYRYDSSLAPELQWDGANSAREDGERLLAETAAELEQARRLLAEAGGKTPAKLTAALAAAGERLAALKAMSQPFLNWSGKAERPSFEIPTLPLFVHERLSTSAILETLKSHKRQKTENLDFLDALFGAPERPLADQVLRAYEHRDQWVNRLILGDSLAVMNSLLRYESLGGQVQMIYIDPPYGVKFGSNFQPFIRKRDVAHNDDEALTREPEMVQAYRDTWELGLHSYLSYLRDRLLLARDLLHPSGSVFVQISDENLHHVREIMDEVFGAENFCGLIAFRTTGGQSTSLLSTSTDFLVWYAKDKKQAKSTFHNPTFPKIGGKDDGSGQYTYIEPTDLSQSPRPMTKEELDGSADIPVGWRVLAHDTLYSQGAPSDPSEIDFTWKSRVFRCPPNTHWKPGVKSGGMQMLASANRLMQVGNTLRYKRYLNDYPVYLVDNIWNDTAISGFGRKKEYVVETSVKVVERCILMTTNPGDLVLDPTCGSGTTAYVAESWGRRWITCDTSRVPLALARQRLLTGSFDYYELAEESRGPAGGFVYKRRQNAKGEEVGGIVPHITLKSIANNEPPAEEVLVDRPEVVKKFVRVCGPFTVEATIPAAESVGAEKTATHAESAEDYRHHLERMTEILRRSPVIRLPGNQSIKLRQVRPPAKTLALSAEALIDAPTLANLADDASKQPELMRDSKAVAILFGPPDGPVTQRAVREAWDEAGLKRYSQLLVIGFGIDPKAREFVEKAGQIGIPALYLQATMDLQMGDLLKNMRSSQVFSVCGLPDVKLTRAGDKKSPEWQVELQGLDTFDPATMEPAHLGGAEVPAWLLDTDYNGMVFRVRQAFFPRTGAWENLKRDLRARFDDTVWDHLSGTVSAPFAAGDHGQIAVKVIDPRGNELMVVKTLEAPQ